MGMRERRRRSGERGLTREELVGEFTGERQVGSKGSSRRRAPVSEDWRLLDGVSRPSESEVNDYGRRQMTGESWGY